MKNLSKLRSVLFTSSILLASLNVSYAEEFKASDFTAVEAAAVQHISRYGSSVISWDRFKKLIERNFDQQDKSGQGISKADVNLTKMVREANNRATNIQKWLRYDLDGDGSITQEELVVLSKQPFRVNSLSVRGINMQIKPSPEQSEMILNKIMESVDFPDENNDGIISFDEMLKTSNKSLNKNSTILARYSRNIGPEFDDNKDGVVKKEEYVKGMRDMFVRFDKNKNDILERGERDSLQDVSFILNR